MADNKPRGRQKNATGQSAEVHKRGEGLGTGPVGNAEGYSGRPGLSTSVEGNVSVGGVRASSLLNKKSIIIVIVLVVLFLLFKNKLPFNPSDLGSGSSVLENFTSSSVSTGWSKSANTGVLNTKVASEARNKYTSIKGNGKDTVTILVYMCGTDLESKSGMATNDLAEMTKATLSDKVNLIVYTGGCSKWQTGSISSSKNQIWQITGGGIKCLEKDMGTKAMTKPSTLTEFIKYGKDKFPANRMCLIFWDHGGGSISGYGYDEKYASSGSMSLTGINTALKDGGIKFDFIGFDACLMATAENAIMLTQYADYMIASEETEPGIGWYYTNWLTKLSANTSISTLEIAKIIVDDFTEQCEQYVNSAKTTLSVVDLAELDGTIPESLKKFATSTTELINGEKYQTVSDARSDSREFATSSKIDQVDLVDLAYRMGTSEGDSLAKAILNAVKYNRTSQSMTNAYGLSIYFPYRKTSYVNNAVKEYDAIGMDDEYADCIKAFAGLEIAGQVSTGGSTSALSSLLGSLSSISTSSTTSSSSGISSLLTGLLSGSSSGIDISGLTSSGITSLLSGINIGKASTFISENHLDATDFEFQHSGSRKYINLPDEKWSLVEDIELNVFVDDGKGYIDLGLDNTFTVEDGILFGDYDGTWLAVNGQIVSYYHMSTVDDGTHYSITGRIPVLYNGDRAELIAVFSNKTPKGAITEVRFIYGEETETIAKSIPASEIKDGDKIDFLCDYYSYTGEYLDSYKLGDDTLKVNGSLTLSDVKIDGNTSATYKITDIYGQHFWTSVM